MIKIVGTAQGIETPFAGKYVKSYDAAWIHPTYGYDGGLLELTDDPNEALKFPDCASAIEKWKEQAPKPYDLRPDHKPNRPLTAFSVEIG